MQTDCSSPLKKARKDIIQEMLPTIEYIPPAAIQRRPSDAVKCTDAVITAKALCCILRFRAQTADSA